MTETSALSRAKDDLVRRCFDGEPDETALLAYADDRAAGTVVIQGCRQRTVAGGLGRGNLAEVRP